MASYRIGIAYLIVSLFLLTTASCIKQSDDNQVTGASVHELKQTACDAADRAETCKTRLPELGFVTSEECCELFQKCCD